MGTTANAVSRVPWKKGKIVGQKAPFKLKDICALRVRLQMENRVRELALFNLGIDSKLRGCDLVALKVRDISRVNGIAPRLVDIKLTKVTKQPPQRRAGAVAGIPTGLLDTPLDMLVSNRSWLRRWRATSPRRRPSSTAA